MQKQTTIISLGGSIIIPPTGFDISFLKKFKSLILSEIKKGKNFLFVVGGGDTCRRYQKTASAVTKLKDVELDWLGTYSTHLNANFVRILFGDLAYKEIITDPTKKIKTSKPIIIAGGWKPGWSTDYDAVELAKVYKAGSIINMSNISYVYDKDPRKNKNAKKIKETDWNNFRKIIGDKWSPGGNFPFDPEATKLAQKLGLTVKFVKGTDLKQVQKAVNNEKFSGSVIK